MSTVVCFDLDSTLRNTWQRQHLAPFTDPTKTWDDYSAAGINDEPIPGSVRLLKLLHLAGHEIHIVSGSSESARDLTMQWLDKHVGLEHISVIRLRPDGDNTRNEVMKGQYVLDLLARGREVSLFVEDWLPGARYIEAVTGVLVLPVNPGYPCKHCGWDPVRDDDHGVDGVGGGL